MAYCRTLHKRSCAVYPAKAIRADTTLPVVSIKGQRPRTAAPNSWTMCRTSAGRTALHICG
jgi:hypothetical protein